MWKNDRRMSAKWKMERRQTNGKKMIVKVNAWFQLMLSSSFNPLFIQFYTILFFFSVHSLQISALLSINPLECLACMLLLLFLVCVFLIDRLELCLRVRDATKIVPFKCKRRLFLLGLSFAWTKNKWASANTQQNMAKKLQKYAAFLVIDTFLLTYITLTSIHRMNCIRVTFFSLVLCAPAVTATTVQNWNVFAIANILQRLFYFTFCDFYRSHILLRLIEIDIIKLSRKSYAI